MAEKKIKGRAWQRTNCFETNVSFFLVSISEVRINFFKTFKKFLNSKKRIKFFRFNHFIVSFVSVKGVVALFRISFSSKSYGRNSSD